MKISGNTILITGGSIGIGLALAEEFIKNKNTVIICGRDETRLKDAKQKFPELIIRKCDVANTTDITELKNWLLKEYPEFNFLINNAGIQHDADFANSNLPGITEEININLSAPIQLIALFVDHLKKQKESAVMNVTSGLAFSPLVIIPIYCATKAALHSFTMSLRKQLEKTSVNVFELAPPMVDTGLGGGNRDQRGVVNRGIQPVEVATAMMKGLQENNFEILVGGAANLKANPEKMFAAMNQ